jgi:hypothetical protein
VCLSDGTYPVTWGGYVVTTEIDTWVRDEESLEFSRTGQKLKLTAKQGIRTPKAPATLTVVGHAGYLEET